MCHAANVAVIDLIQRGFIDSASLMIPPGWSAEAAAFAARTPAADVGVHLVLTSEWGRYRWRPLTGLGSGLADVHGFFHRDVRAVEELADEVEIRDELHAQLRAALAAGVDVTHLDSHMAAVFGLETGRVFFPVLLDLAAEHGLPIRLPRAVEGIGLQPGDQAAAMIDLADRLGVVIIDHLQGHPFELDGEGTVDEERYDAVRDRFLSMVRGTTPGVTEIFLHPMLESEELWGAVDYADRKRAFEYRLLQDPLLAQTLTEESIVRTNWRSLRNLQRATDRVVSH